ncbi:response regulator [Staphylococcus phage VB-SauS-SA2]|nr:response regulator [Staphylococcus phage VB-SauS-SA2]
MAFTSQQNFLASIDGVTANELNRVMDRTLDNYDERKKCIEETLEGTTFFEEYFADYYNVNASQNDYLSLENNVCKVLENYASYLLNSKDIDDEETEVYKFYYDESEFMRAINKDVKYDDKGPEVIDFLLANQSNYKKAKDQKITASDLRRNDYLGEVLRDYQTYIDALNNGNMQAYRRNRLKGEVQRDMILAKDALLRVHGYNLRYFSESTKPNLEVFDFVDFNQLKGFTVDGVEPRYTKVDGLLRMKFNGDFQHDFQCILYDLEILIEKTKLTDREKECLNYFRNGLTNTKIGDILSISQQAVTQFVDSAIKKINKKAYELQWR